jgi:hypothetical protein
MDEPANQHAKRKREQRGNHGANTSAVMFVVSQFV